jgi:hypothetical protein
MSIPKSFKLANRTWRVEFVTNLTSGPDDTPCWGTSNHLEAIIRLDKELLTPALGEYLLSTWEHELLHAMLSAHGVRDHDERFVDGMALLRRQYELTKRLPAERKGVIQRKKKAPSRRRKVASPQKGAV